MLRWTTRLAWFFPETPRVSRSQFVRVYSHVVAGKLRSSSAQSPPIGKRDSCRKGHPAIDILKQLLSLENAASNHPCVRSPATIRSLYYRVESRNQLERLDSAMLSHLISLFGSLSDPSVSVVYMNPLAFRFSKVTTRRTHWAFVLKVGTYKLTRGIPLQDSDRFWMMRAELRVVQSRPLLEPLSEDAYSAILRASTHYHIIRRHSRCPEVHVHYLEALLTTQDPRLLNMAARDLSFLLRTHRACHLRLRHLLYRLAIQYGAFLSTQSQEAILTAIWSRSRWGSWGAPDLVPGNAQLDMNLGDHATGITSIARSLSTTLFGIIDHPLNDKYANQFGWFFSIFSPAYTLSLRWNSLVLLSIFNSPEMLQFTGVHHTRDHTIPQIIACWRVIFGLATLERITLQGPSSTLAKPTVPMEEVLEITHNLYQSWFPIRKSCPVPGDLSCAVAASFFKIAYVLANGTLLHDCQDLYRAEINQEGPKTSAQKFLVAQYIAAVMRVQGPFPEVVLGILEAFSLDSEHQRQVLSSTVKALAPIDAPLAYILYSVAQEKGLVLEPDVLHSLSVSLAQCGAFREAILFVSDQFSLEKRGILISSIAHGFRENPRAQHPKSVLVAIVGELAALYYSHAPPEHFRGHLEQLFVTLAQRGRGTQLFPVILSVFKRLPNYFQPRFFVRYCHALIRLRQFSTANKLFDTITTVHPQIARSLRIFTDRSAMRTNAFRVFQRTTPLRGPTSLRLSSCLQRHPSSGPPPEISLQELLKSGRVLAAKRIFACAAATISSRQCTALGNILLHGVSRQPTSRNGRRVRKVLSLMENLVKHHYFRPDRVTVNILIRAMMNWRPMFDSPRLRELFNQLVRGEYPAANFLSPHPPFGTQRMQVAGSSGFLKLPPFVSFERHTRPLLKMFIKAFYLCNDVEAARKVVGILKAEACKNVMAKEVRQRARSRGRVKTG